MDIGESRVSQRVVRTVSIIFVTSLTVNALVVKMDSLDSVAQKFVYQHVKVVHEEIFVNCVKMTFTAKIPQSNASVRNQIVHFFQMTFVLIVRDILIIQ